MEHSRDLNPNIYPFVLAENNTVERPVETNFNTASRDGDQIRVATVVQDLWPAEGDSSQTLVVKASVKLIIER